MAKRMTAQMKLHKFDPFDPTSIARFLKNFKPVCDTNGILKGAAMSLFHFLMNRSASAVINARRSANKIQT